MADREFPEQDARRYSRREVLSTAGRLTVGATAFAALAAACGGGDDGAGDTAGTTSAPATGGADTQAATTAEASGGTLDRPLRLHHDAAVGPLFEPYVQDFNARYAPIQLETSYVPQDYYGTTQTQLAGGSVDYDVLFSDVGYLEKWYQAGWIRDIEDMPGIADLLAALPEQIAASLRTLDGTLAALPYYIGTDIFIYNADHLSQINAQPPATWEEMMDQARELKSKGIVSTPYSPFWTKDFFMMWYQLLDWTAGDGAGDYFDENLQPLFQNDPVVVNTVERWKTIYDEELVPKDIFTVDYGNTVNIFAGGKSTFTHQYQLELLGFNNPDNSQVAGQAKNALMPGAAQDTFTFPAYWHMTASTPDPETAWQLMSYLAWEDKDGEIYVPKNLIALDLGLGTPYEAVNSDPEVTESWGAWADVDLLLQQIEKSKGIGPVANQEWFPKFQETIAGLLQQAVVGDIGVQDALSEAADFATSQQS